MGWGANLHVDYEGREEKKAEAEADGRSLLYFSKEALAVLSQLSGSGQIGRVARVLRSRANQRNHDRALPRLTNPADSPISDCGWLSRKRRRFGSFPWIRMLHCATGSTPSASGPRSRSVGGHSASRLAVRRRPKCTDGELRRWLCQRTRLNGLYGNKRLAPA